MGLYIPYIQEFFIRQKVKINAVLIEYHGDSGMN